MQKMELDTIIGFTVDLPDGSKEYRAEFTKKTDKSCAVGPFIRCLDFVKANETFKISRLQGYLKCGYGTACKVLDALLALCAVEKISGAPCPVYKSLIK